jgi:peptide/nickel transport system substrate-binding protein
MSDLPYSFDPSRRSVLSAGGAAILAMGLPGKATAATPKKGGHLRLATLGGATSDSTEVALWDGTFRLTGLGAVHEFLTEVDADGQLRPRLAESWESTDRGKTWIFKIRKDVVFTNGKTIDAADVVASWNYHKRPNSKSGAKSIAELARPRAGDATTVVFELDSPSVDFPYSTAHYQMAILPSREGDITSAMSDIGAGPYSLELHEAGVRILLKKNPNYWNAGIGHADTVELLNLSDANARTNALITGQVDAIDSVPLTIAKQLKSSPGIIIIDTPSKAHATFPMLTDRVPFNDSNMRMALKYALDRQAILEKVFMGYGTVGNDQPLSPAYRYHDASLPQRSYDPDKAKWYIKQANLGSLSVDIHVSGGAWSGGNDVDGAAIFRESAARAGINLNIVRVPRDSYWTQAWQKVPICATNWSGRPTADEILTCPPSALMRQIG